MLSPARISSAASRLDTPEPGLTIDPVLDATEFIIPAFEILDTRVVRADPASGRTRSVFDTIADNAANVGIVMGGRPLRPREADLRWLGAIVARNGIIEETGLAAGVLGHPALGIAWLAGRLHAQGVAGLQAGEVVLSGSFIRPIEAGRGDTFVADYGPCGTVSCRFVQAAIEGNGTRPAASGTKVTRAR